MKQDPSDHLFVVDAPQDRATERLSSLGTVEPLAGNDRLLLLSVPAGAEGDAEARWEQARDLLGDLGTVQPVLLDESGEAHFPTGEIAVRFHEAPPDERLQELAAAHGLRLRDRNEYVPQQAVFRPADPAAASYLPKLVRELAQTEDVKAAWASTLTKFRRGA